VKGLAGATKSLVLTSQTGSTGGNGVRARHGRRYGNSAGSANGRGIISNPRPKSDGVALLIGFANTLSLHLQVASLALLPSCPSIPPHAHHHLPPLVALSAPQPGRKIRDLIIPPQPHLVQDKAGRERV
jgi:hypothetical protein